MLNAKKNNYQLLNSVLLFLHYIHVCGTLIFDRIHVLLMIIISKWTKCSLCESKGNLEKRKPTSLLEIACAQSYLVKSVSFPVEHERIRSEFGCGVYRCSEEKQHRVQEVIPLCLFFHHHLHYGLLQQRTGAIV